MDVPCKALHENIKRFCEKQSKTKRKYNKKNYAIKEVVGIYEKYLK